MTSKIRSLAAMLAITLPAGLALGQVPYHSGGPILGAFTIFPLYLGNSWSAPRTGPAAVAFQQSYLTTLVAFISGRNAPASEQPYLKQYGVASAALGPPVVVGAPDGPLSDASIRAAITSAQTGSGLAGYGPTSLVVVFPGTGQSPGTGAFLGYHQIDSSKSVPAYYAVVFSGSPVVSQAVGSSHEIQEAATDPAYGIGHPAWMGVDSDHEICDDLTCGDAKGTFQSFTYSGITIIGCADNTRGGACTTTGFTSTLPGTAATIGAGRFDANTSFDLISVNTGPAPFNGLVIPDSGYTNVLTAIGPTTFSYGQWLGGIFNGAGGNFFGDVDGDGLADLVGVSNGFIGVVRSTGSTFGGYETWSTGVFNGTHGNYLADVTGDGKADVIGIGNGFIAVLPSTGSATHGFSPYQNWFTGNFFGVDGTFFADVTGPDTDGKRRADGVAFNGSTITVARAQSNGTFATPETWVNGVFNGTHGNYIADVTGDGLADVVGIGNGFIAVIPSTGSLGTGGFTPYQNWLVGDFFGQRQTLFVDVNGDGKADAVAVDNNQIRVMLSTGGGFAPVQQAYIGGF